MGAAAEEERDAYLSKLREVEKLVADRGSELAEKIADVLESDQPDLGKRLSALSSLGETY